MSRHKTASLLHEQITRLLLACALDGASEALNPVGVKIDEANSNAGCVAINGFRLDRNPTLLVQIDCQHQRCAGGLFVGEVDESAAEIQVEDEDRCLPQS